MISVFCAAIRRSTTDRTGSVHHQTVVVLLVVTVILVISVTTKGESVTIVERVVPANTSSQMLCGSPLCGLTNGVCASNINSGHDFIIGGYIGSFLGGVVTTTI